MDEDLKDLEADCTILTKRLVDVLNNAREQGIEVQCNAISNLAASMAISIAKEGDISIVQEFCKMIINTISSGCMEHGYDIKVHIGDE